MPTIYNEKLKCHGYHIKINGNNNIEIALSRKVIM